MSFRAKKVAGQNVIDPEIFLDNNNNNNNIIELHSACAALVYIG